MTTPPGTISGRLAVVGVFAEPLPLVVGAAAAGPFTPTFANRQGEQVRIGSAPLDVRVVLDSEVTARADLTIVLPRVN
ncbi:hypothetical protein [Streptomyces sp. NPDC001056]